MYGGCSAAGVYLGAEAHLPVGFPDGCTRGTNIKDRESSKIPAVFAITTESTMNSKDSLKIQTFPLSLVDWWI